MTETNRETGLLARVRRRIGNFIAPDVEVTPPPQGAHVSWDVPVKVRDGTTLRVNVFRPDSSGPVPVIMSAHPYGKDKIAARTRSGRGVNPQYRVFLQPEPVRVSAWTSWEAPDPAMWIAHGYAVVNADLRGGGTSDGVGDLFSDQEAQDYFDLIEWAATQPWSSGRVGLDGVSYLAISQYKVAALRPAGLAAICPWEGFTDLYRDFARPGGVREDGFSILWSKLTSMAARMHGTVRRQIVNRPELDDWYRSITPDLARIEVPMLICGSFSDHSLHSRGSFEAFRRAGSAHKRIYTHRGGKWCTYYSEDATRARLRFFDHHLKGMDNGLPQEPPVRLAIYEAGARPVAVVAESAFPPPDLDWRRLHLDAATSRLDTGAADGPASQVSFATRGEGVSFDWVVPEDMDIIGPMALRLQLGLRGADDACLFAGVRKLRGGIEVKFEGSFGFSGDMVSKGWQRVAHRELDARLSTPAQPVHRHDRVAPVAPGEIVEVDIALLPHATRVRAGDVLRLQLRGSWFYPRNPFRGQFPVGYQRSGKTICTIHTGAGRDAYLLLGHRAIAETAAGNQRESALTNINIRVNRLE